MNMDSEEIKALVSYRMFLTQSSFDIQVWTSDGVRFARRVKLANVRTGIIVCGYGKNHLAT